ncbi:Kelch repeat-containing protein [Actomonas aquatica]|uniref:Kelch repeat-containing protein n=1 Tax=Actomonas aquatica TaxID=2866162 RepID=A0ABZ1CB70_9BACT|nr:kelch repeat-containing protein [Opitutus sp. WL0086]WRQ88931.1 kelch repeat-containing protein [Opitutus sp. WL0086]
MSRFKKLILTIFVVGALLGVFFHFWWMRSWGPRAGVVDTPAGRYDWAADLPVARTEAGGTSVGNTFYVLGGINAWAQTYQDLLAFDAASNQWEERAPFPYLINHPGVTNDGRYVYVAGGFGPLGIRLRGFMFARWDPMERLWRYDPATNAWAELASMPAPRGAGGVTWGDGKLWYVGGINENRELAAELFAYDPKTDTWEEMPPMPTPRDHMRLEYVDGALYALSGRKDDMRFNLGQVERFDIATRTWSSRAPIPTPRGGFGSAVLDGRIYTFGGEAVWTCFETVEIYDPQTDTWSTGPSLPEARHGIIAGAIGDDIHLVSGGRHPRVSISALHRVFTPTPRPTQP